MMQQRYGSKTVRMCVEELDQGAYVTVEISGQDTCGIVVLQSLLVLLAGYSLVLTCYKIVWTEM
jgi:hypothetical protein